MILTASGLLHGGGEDAGRWEQRRYHFLERIYALTGADCSAVVDAAELDAQLDVSVGEVARLIEDLEQLGYLQTVGDRRRICLTEKGVRYLQKDAWRRRSIRE